MANILDDTEAVTIRLLEDFTTYEVFDPGSFLTIAQNRIDVDRMDAGPGAGSDGVPVTYVRKDFGADFFGDFTVFFKVNCTLCDLGGYSLLAFLASDPSTITGAMATADVDGLGFYFYRTVNYRWIILKDFVTQTEYATYFEENIDYYIKYSRTGTLVTIGIYYDEEMTDVYKESSKIMSDRPYRFLLPIANRGSAGVQKIDLILEDLSVI